VETTDKPLVKVELRGGEAKEGLWAVDLGSGRYRLQNLPFLVTGYALGDIVTARADPASDLPVVEAVAQRSGHSLYQVIVNRAGDVAAAAELLSRLEKLGCGHEQATDALYAIDVPPEADRRHVEAIVDEGLNGGIWKVQDAFVAGDHSGDIPAR
jgi:hypothetical protein